MTFHPSAKAWARLAVVGLVLHATGERVWANAPAPPPVRPDGIEKPTIPTVRPNGPAADFVVRRDGAEQHSRIVIPRRFLPARPNRVGERSVSGAEQRATSAGLSLATVITGGGLAVVFVRRRQVGAAAAVLVVMLGLTVALGTAAATSPPSPLNNGGPSPQVTVEIVESGNAIQLLLGKDAPPLGP